MLHRRSSGANRMLLMDPDVTVRVPTYDQSCFGFPLTIRLRPLWSCRGQGSQPAISGAIQYGPYPRRVYRAETCKHGRHIQRKNIKGEECCTASSTAQYYVCISPRRRVAIARPREPVVPSSNAFAASQLYVACCLRVCCPHVACCMLSDRTSRYAFAATASAIKRAPRDARPA
jgi:hypothetical protein